ncbi:putative RNA recognition motif domain, nucleotide-binding alpha-beta plait domain superfamily [Helianthus annuus]|nr:putative RNA recognition motif domain, nucleotide-binding alpha-beta plait domain superfamily [Helianthus annuus]
MAGRGVVTKFFVSNLPEGCTPWELRSSLEGLGEISGTFVAKKRDKTGSRFGFVSFCNVHDCLDLEKKIRGIRMGEFKLKANVARFVVENSGQAGRPELKAQAPRTAGVTEDPRRFNVKDSRSYCDVVGRSLGGGECSGAKYRRGEERFGEVGCCSGQVRCF